MKHEIYIRKLISNADNEGRVKARERNDLEYKEKFGKNSFSKYAKTMASFANNKGGYIVFGIKDSPREILGVNNSFREFKQEELTEYLNSLFSPEIMWEARTIDFDGFSIGFIYTYEAIAKPVVALKNLSSEKINSGDVYYRYNSRSEKIKYPEMHKIIEERAKQERNQILKLIETIRKSDTTNLGIVNYNSGKFSTPYGADVMVDKKLVLQVLKKAKYIKQGSFDENNGTPVLKVTGNIDLSEEVPVPDIDPDIQYPYLQTQLADKLNVSKHIVMSLVWYYKMKGIKKFHIEISPSSTSKQKIHKFSDIALTFLANKLNENKNNPDWIKEITQAHSQRNR